MQNWSVTATDFLCKALMRLLLFGHILYLKSISCFLILFRNTNHILFFR